MSQRAPSAAVLCAGRLYCDLVFTGVPALPTMGTETFSDGLSVHAGGGAFITAASLSALGHPASLLATLPAAPFDTVVADQIAAAQVDLSQCRPAARGAAPQLTVAIAGAEDRAFLSHKSGAALPTTAFPGDAYAHLHIGELRTLVEHPNLIAAARRSGMTLSTDCGYDDALLANGSDMRDLLSQVDVFLPNESEFAQLRQTGLPEATAPLTVIKRGANGAEAVANGAWTAQPTHPAKVVDATGAGDAFNGGFLAGWLAGQPLTDCLALGNRCGRASIGQVGGTGGLPELRKPAPAGAET